VVLQLAGGFGVGPIANFYRALLDVKVPIQLATVAGRNEQLKAELEGIPCPPLHRAKVFGFTREIDELMAAADLVVTKPGGLTTSETLARGAVMVIVNPIPGQESRNSDFLLESGAAVKANSTTLLTHKVTALLQDPKRLELLKGNVRRVARPRAAFDIVKRSLEMIGTKPSA
jgi:processive 1,2-diacylglycerol beta-glucosyltransferase